MWRCDRGIRGRRRWRRRRRRKRRRRRRRRKGKRRERRGTRERRSEVTRKCFKSAEEEGWKILDIYDPVKE